MLIVTGGIELPICDFLLVCNSNHMAISHHLSVCGYLKILSVCYHWGNISDPHPQVAPLLLLGQRKLLIKLNSSVDLDFDHSRSLKVRYDGIVGLPIYVFLVRFSCNIWPNMAYLRDTCTGTSPSNASDLDSDVSRSLKVRCDGVIELPIYGFLFMFNTKIPPNSALL